MKIPKKVALKVTTAMLIAIIQLVLSSHSGDVYIDNNTIINITTNINFG